MSTDLQIKVTHRGFEVVAAGRTTAFATIDDALGFVGTRLQRISDLRDISARCE